MATMLDSIALEEFNVGRESLPVSCLLLCAKYLAQCLVFNKYLLNKLFFSKKRLLTFVAEESVGQQRMIAVSNGFEFLYF